MMNLPLFTLLVPAQSLDLPGELVWERPHEHARGAQERCFQIAGGHIVLTTWKGVLHCVVYQTPLKAKKSAAKRNRALFEHYGEGRAWNEILDNGFGKTYRRDDMERFSLWSYAMDFNTFGTMAFHAVKWG